MRALLPPPHHGVAANADEAWLWFFTAFAGAEDLHLFNLRPTQQSERTQITLARGRFLSHCHCRHNASPQLQRFSPYFLGIKHARIEPQLIKIAAEAMPAGLQPANRQLGWRVERVFIAFTCFGQNAIHIQGDPARCAIARKRNVVPPAVVIATRRSKKCLG